MPAISNAAAPIVREAARRVLALTLAELRELIAGHLPEPSSPNAGSSAALDDLCRRAAVPVDARTSLRGRLPAGGGGGGVLRRQRGARERGQALARERGAHRSASCAGTPRWSSRSATTASAAPTGRRHRVCAGSPTVSRPLGGRCALEPARPRDDDRSGDSVRVVVADDAVILREGLARLLTEAGFEIAAAAGRHELAGAGRAERARRRDRRHPDAADAHRRGPSCREGDPRARRPTGILVLSQYVPMRATPLELLSSGSEGVGLPPQGARLRSRRARLERSSGSRRAAPSLDPLVVDAARRPLAAGGDPLEA